jgi:hypothetical protein
VAHKKGEDRFSEKTFIEEGAGMALLRRNM